MLQPVRLKLVAGGDSKSPLKRVSSQIPTALSMLLLLLLASSLLSLPVRLLPRLCSGAPVNCKAATAAAVLSCKAFFEVCFDRDTERRPRSLGLTGKRSTVR